MDNLKIRIKFWQIKRKMGPIPKNGVNPHTRSQHHRLDDIVHPLDKLCDEFKVAWSAEQVGGGINGDITQQQVDGKSGVVVENRGQAWAEHAVTFVDLESGESLTFKRWSIVDTRMGGAQSFGSADTYAVRYLLVMALGLYETDDDGNAASGRGVQSNNKQAAGNGLVI